MLLLLVRAARCVARFCDTAGQDSFVQDRSLYSVDRQKGGDVNNIIASYLRLPICGLNFDSLYPITYLD